MMRTEENIRLEIPQSYGTQGQDIKRIIHAKYASSSLIPSHRIRSRWSQLLVEVIEGVLLSASQVLRLGDLVEEPRTLVHPVFANVDVRLYGAEGAPPAEGARVEHPALTPDGV